MRRLQRTRRGPSVSDLDSDVPLTWSKVLLALTSYCLFFTDIPRSGYGFKDLPATYFATTETLYANFGPYAYPIIAIERHINGSIESSSPFANVWSYKFDTCSVGLRTVVAALDVGGWHDCFAYTRPCPRSILHPLELLTMLDNVVTAVQAHGDGSWRVSYFFVDIINDIFAFGGIKERDWRRVQTHYVTSSTADLCDPTRDQAALFCEQPWTDFESFGGVALRLMPAIQAQLQAAERRVDLTTQRVDMAIVVGSDDLRPWAGGFAKSYLSAFDVVTLLRIQNCSDVLLRVNCSTVYLADYRYEGGLGRTNTRSYYRLTACLRTFGQFYNISRTMALIFGCYVARRHERKYRRAPLLRTLYAALTLWLRIPAQVVIYGSWLPVLLFALAHLIDAPFLYFTIYMQLGTLNGTFSLDERKVYDLIVLLTCHMRNVWVLSLCVKALLVLGRRDRDRQALYGFRGYLLPLVSFLSMAFEVRLIALRDTSLLHVRRVVPSSKVALIREFHALPTNYRYWGVGSDVKNLVLSWLLVYLSSRLLPTTPRLAYATTMPFTLLRFCHRSMFTTAWSASARETSAYLNKVHAQIQVDPHRRSLFKLMHITWMTDPLQYVTLRLTRPIVCVYRMRVTGALLHHALPPCELLQLDACLLERVEWVGEVDLLDLPWHERIRCY
ncbi:hypothetical protein SPRG_02241 [Saprolegnia parasitica CBS 223.65]|uniref:Uncharacterized protein n=1 Tax=Saprolegnia parasitica (strain CBS 223.65) TaxID=695850 RepID=A0A067CRT9_SAPPC|nr:hypothetical protein SPRG_02241 [Saprolegnia parasitica CBS 223.65]KDO33434.1 hypothetical protein SPRG_02241 [Saprolegnia parasitica CBS 223.65]|eukprot:XP_012196180.1 hypothetical protein SPRG_02241 [Saprolegnia parasitica CBS 223.65]